VKMSIEQKDVLGASTLTPTFTERTMTGTARIQNNRTMMLASVSTDVETRGRKGIAFLGGLPILGRLFTSPTRDLRQVDIVIAVTPRVLRAPAVTPRDEEMRPSGTLQSPTTGTLEAMIRETDRDDQIAAARMLPRNPTVQLPDAPIENVSKAAEVAQNKAPITTPPPGPATVPATGASGQTPTATAQNVKPSGTAEELPSFVPAPKSLVSNRSAAEVATMNTGVAGNVNALLTSPPKAVNTSLNTTSGSYRVARISFLPIEDVLKVGEKRRYAIQLSSDVSISLALLALRFDPKVVRINTVLPGSLLTSQTDAAPALTQSIDASGVCLISISALNGKTAIKGSGALIFIDVEAVGAGDAAFILDKDTSHVVATDARDILVELSQGRAIVKQ
jgi:general secretion pathway protein D